MIKNEGNTLNEKMKEVIRYYFYINSWDGRRTLTIKLCI